MTTRGVVQAIRVRTSRNRFHARVRRRAFPWATCATVPGTASRLTRVYLGYVCDSNVDCEDGYDEKPELCAAGTLCIARRFLIDRHLSGYLFFSFFLEPLP